MSACIDNHVLIAVSLTPGFKDHLKFPKTPGVYAIRHKGRGKLYIGSTRAQGGVRARLYKHLYQLRNNKHGNAKLQASFNFHGPLKFELLLLEHTSSETTTTREQWFLEQFQPWITGYNIDQVVDSNWKMSDDTKIKLASLSSKPFQLMFNDQIYEGYNLTAFSRKRGLHQGALTQVLLGNKRQFKGWTLPGNPLPTFRITFHPTGRQVTVPYFHRNVVAKAIGLHRLGLTGLIEGKLKIFKGWSLASTVVTAEELQWSLLPQAEKCRINGRKAHPRRSLQNHEV